jgi:hypothetical protein
MSAPNARRETARIRRLDVELVAGGDATEGRYAIVEHRVPVRTVTMPLHAFSREIVTYYGLAGTTTVARRGEDAVRLGPGDALVVPAGVMRALLVRDGDGAGRDRDEPARFLTVFAPAGVEGYYAAVAASISPTGVPDLPAVLATSERFGIAVDMASLYDLVDRFGVHLV